MEFRILGPLQVVTDEGAVVRLSDGRQRILLALLLVNPQQTIPLDYLVDAVWDDRPPATARRQIQNCVSAIRRQLGEHAAGNPIIAVQSQGYRLHPGAGTVDAVEFAADVVAAGRLAQHRPAEAATRLREALRRWRGPALAGMSGRVIQAAAARLDEQRLAAQADCLDLELQRGQAPIGELTELAAANPLRERFVGQLMRALHGAGRRAEALAAYHALRQRLAEELALDPGAALNSLYTAILEDDPALQPDDEPVPAAAEPVVPAQLPADVVGFTGREDHLKTLYEQLPGELDPDANAVVISAVAGMAGVGKTALAVRWGHQVRDRFRDGQLYLDLRGHSAEQPMPPARALAHLLTSLNLPADQVPTDVQAAASRYRSLLSGKRVLVVLDNAADADQVRPLLPGTAGCLVLVTSRDRLSGLVAREGAHRILLDVLSPLDASRLLARLLGDARTAAEPDATEELARVCAYLPLALRVAGANLADRPHTSIADYVRRLRGAGSLSALEVAGDAESGVRRAFDLSYQALDDEQRRAFRMFGLLPGPDLTAAAAAAMIGSDPGRAQPWLDRLAAVHLVTEHAAGRYGCHDLLRSYAAEACAREDSEAERRAAEGRLYGWYQSLVDAAALALDPLTLRLPATTPGTALPGPTDRASIMARLDAEHANLIAAVRRTAQHGPRPVAWQLTDALRGYFWSRMPTADWQLAATSALQAATEEHQPRARVMALISLGDLRRRQVRDQQAIEHYREAFAEAEAAGWVEAQAAAAGNLAIVSRDCGQVRESAHYHRVALELARSSGARHTEAVSLLELGRSHSLLGHPPEALDLLNQSLALCRALGAVVGEAAALGYLGDALRAEGRLDEATRHLDASLVIARQWDSRMPEAYLLRMLAAVHRDAGRLDEAESIVQTVLGIGQETGEVRVQAAAMNVQAGVEHRRGRHEEALDQYWQVLGLMRDTSDYAEVEALVGVSAEQLCLQQPAAARDEARAALELARRIGYGRLERAAAEVLRRA